MSNHWALLEVQARVIVRKGQSLNMDFEVPRDAVVNHFHLIASSKLQINSSISSSLRLCGNPRFSIRHLNS